MADTRINALSTATSSASDDFVPIDGTTNGTRKLSAYSPSFGGNATVGGTLTVSNQLKVTNATIPDLWLQNSSGATSAYRNILIRQNSDNTFKFLSTSDAGVLTKDNIITGSNDTGAIGIGVAPGSGTSSLTVAGAVTISSTTASTSTSSGALVVSGGVGVAGAIYAGGAINSTQTISGNDLVATAGYAEIKGYGGTAGNGILFLGQSANNNFISGTSSNMTFRLSNTTRLTVDATDITVASGTALKLGNAYVAGAPTATGYIVIKDSTGTSYKIPAVAL